MKETDCATEQVTARKRLKAEMNRKQSDTENRKVLYTVNHSKHLIHEASKATTTFTSIVAISEEKFRQAT
jgi:hypothetical protein